MCRIVSKWVGKIVNLLLHLILAAAVVLLGAALAARIHSMLNRGSEEQTGILENRKTRFVEDRKDNSALLKERCSRMEEALGKDTELHVNSMLQSPGEYNIWETLSGISRIGEEGLTEEEWLLWKKLCWYEACWQEWRRLPEYSNQFSDLTGVLGRLPEVFFTWHFDCKEDIEAYQETLKKIPGLMNRFLETLDKQRQSGMLYFRDTLEKWTAECEYQLTEESLFLEDFRNKIQDCNFLTIEEKNALIEENRRNVEKYVWASYERVLQTMGELPPSEVCYGLGHYPGGKEYYEYLLKCTTGSDRSVEEMYEDLEKLRLYLRQRTAAGTGQKIPEPEQFQISAEGLTAMLYENTQEHFPGTGRIDYLVETLPERMNSGLYQAFYCRDRRTGKNYIYLGEDTEEDSWLTLYQTLAHEAMPGHMYSYNYQRECPFPVLQEQMKCLGYSEGWAVYAEFAAGDWLQEPGVKKTYLGQAWQKLYDETVLCQIDIGIHYMDWTPEDIERFSVEVYGAGSREAAEKVMTALVSNPGAYQAYVVGYMELAALEQKYGGEEKFFEIFHQCGQAPFSIVDAYMGKKFGAQAD